MKKVSIITTCYNARDYIVFSMKSILTQKISKDINVEYIIVNDCSTDDSLIVINDSINKYRNSSIECIVYNLEENLGCGGARKYGIEHATGDYFMFLDADDYYINDDFVSRAVSDIENNNADIVEYAIQVNDMGVVNVISAVYEKTEITNQEEKMIALFKKNLIKFNIWSKIYKREIVNSYPYSNERTYEDVRTIPIWVANSNKIVIMPSVEINYRSVNNSIIRENNLSTRLGTIKAICETFEYFKYNVNILKAMYTRAMIDLEAVLNNKSSYDEGFDEMSSYNTKMLSYIYPDTYKDFTYNIENGDI